MGWNKARSTGALLSASLLAVAALLCGAPGTAVAQTLATIQNSRIVAIVGETGDLNGTDVGGRFGILEAGATGGVLLQLPRSTDLNQLGSFVTVRIDGGTPYASDGTVAEGVAGWDIAWGYTDTPDTDITGEWIQVPTVVSPTKIVAKWRTIAAADATPPIPEIEVDLTMTLIYDMVSYKFTVINRDASAHSVGLRFAQDFSVPQSTDGPVLTPRTGQISNETELFSTLMPAWWRAAAEQGTSTVGSVLLPIGASPNPTRPDRIVFARTSQVSPVLWDVTPDTTEPFVGTLLDGTAAVYYNPTQYAPGERKDITAYVGAAGATYDFGQRIAAGLAGPVSLSYDPSKPADEQLQPNPITLTAFLHNMNTVALSNVRAVLALPSGLELAQGELAVKTAASVAPDGEVTFNWQVVPTGTASGRLTYSVAVSADPGGQGVSVARDLDVPALPTQGMKAGWQMVSFPYVLDDRTPAGAINMNPALYDLVRWNPAVGQYQAVQFINPGEGYWLRLGGAANVTIADGQPVTTSTGNFQIKLARNWNQIANPFLLRVRWADVRVLNTDALDPEYLTPMTVEQASSPTRQWLSSAVFWYDTSAGMYKFDQDFTTDLVPFVGYWVKALKSSIILLIPKPSGRAADLVSARPTNVMGAGWRLRLAATDGATADGWNFFGVAGTSSDTLDPRDVAKPPAIGDAVRMAFLRDVVGEGETLLAQDLQSLSSGRKTWRVAVSTAKPGGDVTLTWPDIATMPRTHELYIADDSGAPRQSMRQTSSLRLNTGPAGTRVVTITGEPRTAAGAFRIVSWNVNTRSRGSAAIAVGTSDAATLTVRVLAPDGRQIRRLATRAASGGQVSQMTWDMRDGAGIAVPAGSYTVEIKAVAGDGQSARVIAPLVVTR